MNDFTKEELQDLYAAIRHCYKQHIDLPSDTDTERFSYCLMEKIDFLIDNYCEHEKVVPNYGPNTQCDNRMMSRRFVKKPLEIEAFLLGSDTRPEWAEQEHIKYYIGFAIINTLEGEMRAEEGDYIIRGIKKEIYPCKADIFEASYDEIKV